MKQGFTLMELLVVIAIIGLLSATVLTSLNAGRTEARDSLRVSQMKQMMSAIELYRATVGRYPLSTNCGATIPNTSWCNSVQSMTANNHWIKDNGSADALTPYMGSEPKDPTQGATATFTPHTTGVPQKSYFYYSDGNFYMLVFGLDRPPHAIESTDGVYDCSGSLWHYGTVNNGVVTLGNSCR